MRVINRLHAFSWVASLIETFGREAEPRVVAILRDPEHPQHIRFLDKVVTIHGEAFIAGLRAPAEETQTEFEFGDPIARLEAVLGAAREQRDRDGVVAGVAGVMQ